MAGIAGAIGSLVGLGMGIFGGFQQRNSQRWSQDFGINVLNWMKDLGEMGMGNTNAMLDFLRPQMAQQAVYAGDQLWRFPTEAEPWSGAMYTQGDNWRDWGNQVHRFMSPQGIDQNIPWEIMLGGRDMQGRAGGMSPTADLMSQYVAGNAWSPQLEQAMGFAGNAMNNPYNTMFQVGDEFISNRGNTAYTEGLKQMAEQTLQGSGWNDQLWGILQPALQAAQDRGVTRVSAQGQDEALRGLYRQGANQASDYATARGMGITSESPLLEFDDVVGMARDEAAGGARAAAETFKRQALARGGGPGAVVSSGIQNEGLSEFEDQAIRAEADAMNRARLGQQGLQVQHFGQGSDMMGTGQALANQRMNSYSDLLRSLEQIQNTRSAAGLAALPEFARVAAQREQMASGMGLGADQAALQRLASGMQLNQQDFSQRYQGGALMNELLGTQGQNLGIGLTGYNNLMGTQGSLMNQALAQQLAARQYSQNVGSQYLQQLATGYQGMQNFMNPLMQYQNANNQMNNDTARTWIDFMGRIGGATAGMWSTSPGQANPWAGALPSTNISIPVR